MGVLGGVSPIFVQVTTALLPQQLFHRHPTPLHLEAEAPDPTPAGDRGNLCPLQGHHSSALCPLHGILLGFCIMTLKEALHSPKTAGAATLLAHSSAFLRCCLPGPSPRAHLCASALPAALKSPVSEEFLQLPGNGQRQHLVGCEEGAQGFAAQVLE